MRSIFVNLPVRDLDKSKAFFAALGFSFNPQFTDQNAACMVIADNIYAMLLTEAYFKTFINGEIGNAATTKEVLVALSAGSRAEVDDTLAKALSAGAKPWKPAQDHGFMYGVSFADLDDHVWEVMWMDPSFVQKG
ncbi:glyoxalase [Labrys miyagiensis]